MVQWSYMTTKPLGKLRGRICYKIKSVARNLLL